MPKYDRHIFICTHRRSETNLRGSCAAKGSEELCAVFKQELKNHKLEVRMRVNTSGCLDQCEQGPSVVIYPDQTFYTIKTKEDILEVVNDDLLQNKTVARLQMKEMKKDQP